MNSKQGNQELITLITSVSGFRVYNHSYTISGCDLSDLDACMHEIVEGMQIRFSEPVQVIWRSRGEDLIINLASESAEMRDEAFVVDQIWDEVLAAFEMAGSDGISFRHDQKSALDGH